MGDLVEIFKREIEEILHTVRGIVIKEKNFELLDFISLSTLIRMNPAIPNFCCRLFRSQYDLNMEKVTENEILLAIYGMTRIIDKSKKADRVFDVTELLLESLSPKRGLDEERTMHVLIRYAKELIKISQSQNYISHLIQELQEYLRKKDEEEETYRKKIDFPKEYGLSDRQTSCVLNAAERIHEDGVQKVYSGVVKSFEN